MNFSIVWRGLVLTGTVKVYPGYPGSREQPPEPAELEITTLKCGDHNAMFLLDGEEELYEELHDLIMNEEPDEPHEDNMTDAEADADTLRSAGMGTDEDYGYFGDYHGY